MIQIQVTQTITASNVLEWQQVKDKLEVLKPTPTPVLDESHMTSTLSLSQSVVKL